MSQAHAFRYREKPWAGQAELTICCPGTQTHCRQPAFDKLGLRSGRQNSCSVAEEIDQGAGAPWKAPSSRSHELAPNRALLHGRRPERRLR
jgi:hypothetical protein